MFKMDRRVISQNQKLTILQIVGLVMLLLGVLSLIGIGIYVLTEKPDSSAESTIAAVSFFLIMMGIAFVYPDMLKSPHNSGTSAMRVVVFMIVSVFVILVVKIYWGCKAGEFKLDGNWAALIGAALGSKALQSLGENRAFTKNGPPLKQNPAANPLFKNNLVNDDLPLHDMSALGRPAAEPPVSVTGAKK